MSFVRMFQESLSGYFRNGCPGVSGIPVRKLQECCPGVARIIRQEGIYVSAGRIGCQMYLAPADFCKAAAAEYADLIRK